MKTKRGWLILAGAVVVAGLFITLGLNRSTEAQHFAAKVERGEIKDVVEATGTINSVITVQVGSQVSGTIAKLNADFNSRVHKGDIVALIDPALFKGALLQATADLQNAKANLEAARANLEKAKAGLVQTKADYDRAVGLTKDGVMSQQQLDLAKSNYDAANASVGAAAANITQAQAQISLKNAAVTVAQTNLDYTVIRSPIDGTVVARNVDVGQTVAASLQAPTIFTIAQDLTKMWVYAKTDESDVDNIQVGKVVTFKVDALPKQTFRRSCQPSADESDHRAKCGHLRHDHRIRKPRVKAVPRDDGLCDHPGGHGAECIEAAEHGPTVQAAHGHRGDSRPL